MTMEYILTVHNLIKMVILDQYSICFILYNSLFFTTLQLHKLLIEHVVQFHV